MFTVRLHIGLCRLRPGSAEPAGAPSGQTFPVGGILRGAAVVGLLALGVPGSSPAQALGTMQVTARVVPASVGWAGLADAQVAARGVSGRHPGQTFVRRGRLVQTTAEVRLSGRRRILLITIQHPHN